MVFLAIMGLPPLAAIQMMQMLLQMKIISTVIAIRYAQAIERQQHLGLPPGEQYRRHLKAGGYRP